MDKYVSETSVGQSSIGLQIYLFDKVGYGGSHQNEFRYLVPIVGDPPELGGTPDTIEITEADSKVKQYVNDRTDSPAIEFNYNFDANGHNYQRVRDNVSATEGNLFALLLPLGSFFILKGTGSTWLAGGNPIQATLSIAQSEEALFIESLDTTTADLTASELAQLNSWLGLSLTSGSTKVSSVIDFTSMPSGRETDAVKEQLAD